MKTMNAKRFFSVMTLVLGLILSFPVKAQVKAKMKKKEKADQIELSQASVKNMSKSDYFAMGVSSARRLKSALMMYETLSNNGVEFKRYEILVWGKIVSELQKNSKWQEKFRKALNDKRVRISVCGFAMKKLHVTKEDLISGLEPVPDAFSRVYELQALGYNVLIP